MFGWVKYTLIIRLKSLFRCMVSLNLNNYEREFVSTGRLSHCVADGLFLRTRQNLAYTPSQMMKLTERGIPVSSQSLCASFSLRWASI